MRQNSPNECDITCLPAPRRLLFLSNNKDGVRRDIRFAKKCPISKTFNRVKRKKPQTAY